MDIDKREQRFYVPKEIVGRVTSVAAYPSRFVYIRMNMTKKS
jgi:hypothetical protein